MSKDFFNARAATWDENVVEKDASKLETMLSLIDISPGDAVLDVGTGTGVFVPFLLRKIGKAGRLVCLDFSEGMLDVARTKKFPGNVSLLCADIEDSGLPDEAFHAVVCYSVFPHFQDKARALREIFRVLRLRGGIYIAHTSSRQAINDVHHSLPEVCDHLFPESDEMQRLLSATGFVDINIADGEDSYLTRATKPA